MRIQRGRWLLLLSALLASACNLAVPQVTPTVAPSLTPSVTPAVTITVTPSWTYTATRTATAAPTAAPSATLTPIPSATLTELPAETATAAPTATASDTTAPVPSSTSTDTATAAPTLTPTVTVSPSATLTRTAPPTTAPSRTATSAPTRLVAQVVTPTQPSATPLPPSPTAIILPPTLDATPTFITAGPQPVTLSPLEFTPLATAIPQPAEITPTPFPAPPTLAPTLAATPIEFAIPTLPPDFDPATRSFALGTGAGIDGTAFSLPGGALTFARNPADPNRYARVDSRGVLYLVTDLAAGAQQPLSFAPFSPFEPASREENKTQVTQVGWSPDGARLAFRVSSGATGNQEGNDGVWYVEAAQVAATDPTYHLFRDCPPGCDLVALPNGQAPYQFVSQSFEWSPTGDALLIHLDLPEEGRRALALVRVEPSSAQASLRPPVYRYDYGSWSPDGARLIVSGWDSDRNVVVGAIDRDGAVISMTNARDLGLGWTQDAVERPGGQMVMLASPGAPGGPLALYTAQGQALTGPIGGGAPERVAWSPDRSAVLVVIAQDAGRRYYVADVDDRSIREITAQVAGALAVEWVSGGAP